MKILHIITSSKCWAGMEQYAYDLSRAMIGRGDELCFVIASDGDVVYPRFAKIGKVYLLPLKSKFDFHSIRELRRILKIENPDIIHTHQPKNIFHAHRAKRGMKHVAIVHTLHFELRPTSPHWLYKRIFNMPDMLIAVSQRVRQKVINVYSNIEAQKIVRVLNSVDGSRLEIMSCTPNKVPVIGYAGRLVEEKGVMVMLRAMEIVKNQGIDFRLLIAGRGEDLYVDQLKATISQFGLTDRIEFVGFVDRMGEFVSRIDFALLPSIVSEACSLMLLEYMYLGKAVITTNNGSQPEIITHSKDGLLVDAKDEKMLAQAIIELLTNRDLLHTMGCAAKEKFDNELSFDQFIDHTRNIYLKAIEK